MWVGRIQSVEVLNRTKKPSKNFFCMPAFGLEHLFFPGLGFKLNQLPLPGSESADFRTRMSTIGSPGSRASVLRLELSNSSPGSPAYRQETMGLLSLHNHMDQLHTHTHPVLFLWRTQANTLPLTWQRRRGKKVPTSPSNRMKRGKKVGANE